MTTPMIGLRHHFARLGPNWLIRDKWVMNGEEVESANRVLYSVGVYFDATVDRVRKGIRARFPGGGAPADALPYLGRDRQILRGPAQSRESFEIQLQRAWDDWQRAGSAWALIEQLRAFLSPHEVLVRTVDNHGNWYELERDGDRGNGGRPYKGTPWDWDAQPTKWSRFWVVIHVTTATPQQPWQELPPIGDPDLWDGAIGSPGFTIGSTATPEDVAGVRKVVQRFKPAGTRGVKIIIVFDSSDDAFNPEAGAAPPLPDGTWGHASKNVAGAQVSARSDGAIYWIGTS